MDGHMVFFFLLELPIGYTLACVGALIAISNGIVYTVGYPKARRVRRTAGAFPGIPLESRGHRTASVAQIPAMVEETEA